MQQGLVRPPAVAGAFYPANPATLAADVAEFLKAAETRLPRGKRAAPAALIAPHAGYIYSGAIAADAYARLAHRASEYRRVVIIGPAHRVAFRGIAVSSARAFATPLGEVEQDQAAIKRILDLPLVHVHDEAHAQEHSIEVHLPFLQSVLTQFKIVALVAGQTADDDVAQVLERLADGPGTLLVVSTDLSHYLDYATAQRTDAATVEAIAALAGDRIGDHDACGRAGVKGLLRLARDRGLEAELLDVRNSGDTAGTKDRVVGYASFVFTPSPSALTEDVRAVLLTIAEDSVGHGLDHGKALSVAATDYAPPLSRAGASFITLSHGKRLRGCIGSLAAQRPLITDVALNAYASAFSDPRFAKLGRDELQGLDLGISVLSDPAPIEVQSEDELLAGLRPGIDGLILRDGSHRATFLPQVWDQLGEPKTFLSHLKRKAKLAEDHWSDSMRFWRYTTESFSRPFGGSGGGTG
jgi:AmmeMemoRadiSam system protein B/AmmeMemoRadiSam system protein A